MKTAIRKLTALLLVAFVYSTVIGSTAIIIVGVGSMTSCGSSGTLEQTTVTWDDGTTTGSLQGAINVECDKHDEYINGDPVLSIDEKSAQLAESMVVRVAFSSTSVKTATVRAQLTAVVNRTDAYVNADPDIRPALKKAMLMNSTLIRRMLAESKG